MAYSCIRDHFSCGLHCVCSEFLHFLCGDTSEDKKKPGRHIYQN